MLFALQIALALLIAASIVHTALSAFCTYRFFARDPDHADPRGPGISVLIPVCGMEPGAEENWLAFLRQDYADYEVLFGVMELDDPAAPTLRALVGQFPERVRLIHCAEALGVNHQVSNLIHLRRAARHARLVITDSDMRPGPGYLARVTAPLADPAVGVVTCGYLDRHPAGLGAAMASFGRALDFLPNVLLARWMDGGLKFALGSTIATRQDVLAAFGGLERVVNRIGSDYHIGRMASEAGFRVELSRYLLQNDSGLEPVRAVYRRELRWARTIRVNRGAQFYGMVITFGGAYAALLLLAAGGSDWALALGALMWAVRVAHAAVCIRQMRVPDLARWLWALPLRDAMSLLIWTVSLAGNGVHWRGRALTLQPGGVLAEERRTAAASHTEEAAANG